MFDQPSLSDLSNSLAPPNVQSTQCCVFPKSGVDQQEGAGCWKRSMIILGIWCIFELLLAALCSVLCRAELGGWLPYVGLKGLAPAVSTKELPAQIYLSTSCSWSAQRPFISSLDQTFAHHSASSTFRSSLKITNLAYHCCWPKYWFQRKYMCVTLVVILLQIQKVQKSDVAYIKIDM